MQVAPKRGASKNNEFLSAFAWRINMESSVESFLAKCNELVYGVHGRVADLRRGLGDKLLPKSLIESINNFNRAISSYESAVNSGQVDHIAQAVKMVGVYGQAINNSLQKAQGVDDSLKSMGKELDQLARVLRTHAEDNPALYRTLDSEESLEVPAEISSPGSIDVSLRDLKEKLRAFDQRFNKSIADGDRKASELAEAIGNIGEQVGSELERVKSLHDSSLEEIDEKRKQIDRVLGLASGRVIAGDFKQSAAEEKAVADKLRVGSLFCMGLIVAIVGYSFWETTIDSFIWQASIFRIVLAFLLSVPAGYLARESGKHREQQRDHLQTALDLDAIAPYLAPLPEPEQHRLKAEMAHRIFGRRVERSDGGMGIVNVNEIVLELIKRIGANAKRDSGDI